MSEWVTEGFVKQRQCKCKGTNIKWHKGWWMVCVTLSSLSCAFRAIKWLRIFECRHCSYGIFVAIIAVVVVVVAIIAVSFHGNPFFCIRDIGFNDLILWLHSKFIDTKAHTREKMRAKLSFLLNTAASLHINWLKRLYLSIAYTITAITILNKPNIDTTKNVHGIGFQCSFFVKIEMLILWLLLMLLLIIIMLTMTMMQRLLLTANVNVNVNANDCYWQWYDITRIKRDNSNKKRMFCTSLSLS